MRFEVLTAWLLRMQVFWEVRPCSWVSGEPLDFSVLAIADKVFFSTKSCIKISVGLIVAVTVCSVGMIVAVTVCTVGLIVAVTVCSVGLIVAVTVCSV